MDSLLSIMLPQYITLLDKFVPSVHNWKQSMIRSMQYLLFEILWSLTFHEEVALALRRNDEFLEKIQTISRYSEDEPLKKAADRHV
jgi:hypothetical protein